MTELKDGEIVDIMFLEPDYPMFYKREIQDRNKEALKDAEVTGGEPDIVEMSYKDSGLEWRVCVLRRNNGEGEPNMVTVDIESEEITLPHFPIFSSVLVWGATQHYKRKTKDGRKIGDWIREIGSTKIENGNPKITNLFPSVREHKVNEKEEERREKWRKIISWWNGLSEEEAKETLNGYIARKMLVYHKIDDDKCEYMEIKPGVIVRAKVMKKEGNRFFNLIAFSYAHKTDEGWVRDYYSKGGISNEFGPIVAEKLLKAFSDMITNAENKRNFEKSVEETRKHLKSFEEDEIEDTPWEE